jgi:polyisoprenoid-binding protein YceI
MMKQSVCRLALAATAAALGTLPAMAGRAGAQAAYMLDSANSRVTFQGRAFIRTIVGASDDLDGGVFIRGGDIRSMRGNVRFPVLSLETEPATRKREIAELFGGERHPNIVFSVDSVDRGDSDREWALHGRLTMNGVTRPVSFIGRAQLASRRVRAEGSARVDVRDWQIRPPRRMAGLIGMSPDVVLTFHAEFQARAGQTEMASATPTRGSR